MGIETKLIEIQTTLIILLRWRDLDVRVIRGWILRTKLVARGHPLTKLVCTGQVSTCLRYPRLGLTFIVRIEATTIKDQAIVRVSIDARIRVPQIPVD